MRAEKRKKRNKYIFQLKNMDIDKKLSLRQIAKLVNLSHEQVRQILRGNFVGYKEDFIEEQSHKSGKLTKVETKT